MKHALFVVGLVILSSGAGRAAEHVPVNLLDCEKIADAAQRVRCFDSALAAMKAAAGAPASSPAQAEQAEQPAPAAPVPPVMAPAPPAALPTPDGTSNPSHTSTRFGQELLPAERRPTPQSQETVLLSSIRSIQIVAPKTWLITLANDQVWRQEGTGITEFFEAGDAVRIEKGVVGSYRLSGERTGTKNWVRVTRVR